MNTLHIIKCGESYRVYYNKREAEYQSLAELECGQDFNSVLEYIFEIFRNPHTKRFSVWGCGESWWAEVETEEGHLIEEDGSSPLQAITHLLLNIENYDLSF